MKAGKSSALTGFLPSLTVSSRMRLKVSSSVAMPRISSIRRIIGTGFMKCMPMNLPGRSVAAARRVTEIDDVLVAIRVSSLVSLGQSACRISFLTASSSVAASITRSTLAAASSSTDCVIRASAATRSASSTLPRATWRRMLRSIPARAASRRSWAMSMSVTSSPERAQTWAMPDPICPAPIIAMLCIMVFVRALVCPYSPSASVSAGTTEKRSPTMP